MGQIIRAKMRNEQVPDDVPDKYLTFELGKEVYAIEVMRVKKIIEFSDVTHIPMMPDFIRGILNLQGEVIPVIDLQICFGKAASKVSRQTCIVIVELSGKTGHTVNMGIIVDSVNNVIELSGKEISPPPDFGDSVRTNFIRGVGKVDKHFLLLLDMNHVLSMEEMTALHKAKAQANLASLSGNAEETAE